MAWKCRLPLTDRKPLQRESGMGRRKCASLADIRLGSQGASEAPPSAMVQTIEDATIASSKQLSLQPLKLDSSFPQRPGYGTQGKKIALCANYFELKPPADLPLY